VNQANLKKLGGAANAEELQRAIGALCQPFGSLKNIRLVPNKHREEYLCLVEFGSPNLNPSIIEKLGGIDFGNGVGFRIPFNHAKD